MLNSEELINKVKSYNKFLNLDKLNKAYNFAINAHKNQKRDSGDPYSIHPIAVANILSDLGFQKSRETNGEEITFETLFKKKSNSFLNISKLKSKKNSIKHKEKKVLPKKKINKKNNTLINPNSPFSVLSNLKLKN